MSHSQNHSKGESPKLEGKADRILEAQLRALVSRSPNHDPAVVVPELVKTLGGFDNSASADFTIASFIFYVQVTLNCPDIHKRYEGKLGGLGTPGGEC